MRPLYREANQRLEWRGGHAGLWYDKFCDRWQDDWSGLGDEGKKAWVMSVTATPVGDPKQLKAHATRFAGLLNTFGQTPLPYTLESDFVTGLGREHPVENGFAWHHTLGTPYLPGSSVKGLVRAWAQQWAGASKETLKRIFGSESDKDKNFQVGSVVFLDAVPTDQVQLKADVMTPHYGPYYQDDSGNTPPADWHSPVPVPFLVVQAGQTFLFGVIPRHQNEESQADCEQAKAWLNEALAWLGAGAKTAVGYGRFALDDKAQQALVREQEAQQEAEQQRQELERLAQEHSSLYLELYQANLSGNWRSDKNAFSQAGVIEEWLDKLEADPQSDAVELMYELIAIHYGEVLENPDATEGKKQKPKFKDRQRNFAKRMRKLKESM